MFATLKARVNFFDTGSNNDDEIGIVCAHMHQACAQQIDLEGRRPYTAFFDKLAEGIIRYTSRVLCLDASMALICVAPELRARGVMVSMAAFFPCKVGGTWFWTPSAYSSLEKLNALGWHIHPR